MEQFNEYGPAPPPSKPPKQATSKLNSLLAYNTQVQFKKSGALLEQTNEVKVHMQGGTKSILKKEKKPIEKISKKIRFNDSVEQIEFEKDSPQPTISPENESFEIDQEPSHKTFDFKKEFYKQQLSSSQFPETFGRRPTIPQKSSQTQPQLTRKENEMLTDLVGKYGKGAGMFLKQGGSIGKGMGKFEQGRINPVEAVRKNQYMTKQEAKIQKLIEKGEQVEKENKKDKQKLQEKEKIKEKKWKSDYKRQKKQKQIEIEQQKSQNKKYIPSKTLDISYTDQELTTKNTMKSLQDYQTYSNLPISNQKVVDMTGTETRFFENYQALKTIVNEGQQNDEQCKEYRLLGDMAVTLKYEKEKIKKYQEKLEREVEENQLDNLKYELKQRQIELQKLQIQIQENENMRSIIPKLTEWGEKKQNIEILLDLLKQAQFDAEIQEKIIMKSLNGIKITEVLIIGKSLKEIFQKQDDSAQIIERIMQNVMDYIGKIIQKEWNPLQDTIVCKEINSWINNLAVPVDIINECKLQILVIFNQFYNKQFKQKSLKIFKLAHQYKSQQVINELNHEMNFSQQILLKILFQKNYYKEL